MLNLNHVDLHDDLVPAPKGSNRPGKMASVPPRLVTISQNGEDGLDVREINRNPIGKHVFGYCRL